MVAGKEQTSSFPYELYLTSPLKTQPDLKLTRTARKG